MPDVSDIPQIIGAKKIEDLNLSKMANDRAAATPLPGASSEAFGTDIPVGPYKVRRFVAMDWILIQKLESPLYRMFLELQKPEDKVEDVVWNEEEKATACWLFTTPIRDAKKMVDDGTYKKAVEEQFLYSDGQYTEAICVAIFKLFSLHIKTRLQYAAEVKDSGSVDFFPKPTASVGSGTTSPGS